MIGICFGIGPKYHEAACFAAERMRLFTGLECVVLEEGIAEEIHPSWLKCIVADLFPNEDSFLVFDADMVCIKHWNPKQLFEDLGRPFCAVPDTRDNVVFNECNHLGIPFPDLYVNGGLTIYGIEHAHVWAETWKKRPKCGSFMEQGALNVALLATGVEVCRLPRWYNVLIDGFNGMKAIPDPSVVERAINVHICGTKIRDVLEIQKRYAHDYPHQPNAS